MLLNSNLFKSAVNRSGPASRVRQGRVPNATVTVTALHRQAGSYEGQPNRGLRPDVTANAMAVAQRQATLDDLVIYSPNSTRSLSSLDIPVSTSIAYEVVQGALVRWSHPTQRQPPTIVMVHGILGSRRNLLSFAKLVVERFPSWQVLLVDLRCHGESATMQRPAPNTVASAAQDVTALLAELRLFPRVVIGHSFGGKVVLSMMEQFNRRMPHPVQAWVLDSLPGEVRAGGSDGSNNPGQLIELLRALPMPAPSRSSILSAVVDAGFSQQIANWVVTNLRAVRGGGLAWTFDLDGIADMYRSYQDTSCWGVLHQPPEGLRIDFVKAEHSVFRWGGDDEASIVTLGHGVHLLHDAGHWVHSDNPVGLFDILSPSFNLNNHTLSAR